MLMLIVHPFLVFFFVVFSFLFFRSPYSSSCMCVYFFMFLFRCVSIYGSVHEFFGYKRFGRFELIIILTSNLLHTQHHSTSWASVRVFECVSVGETLKFRVESFNIEKITYSNRKFLTENVRVSKFFYYKRTKRQALRISRVYLKQNGGCGNPTINNIVCKQIWKKRKREERSEPLTRNSQQQQFNRDLRFFLFVYSYEFFFCARRHDYYRIIAIVHHVYCSWKFSK